ncbi:MAG: polysaccharide deacetylase family protein [Chitinivibrionales bacterium]|nr:polysaccharide deacetylase family protein [Chitinivibrionales bacterium]
MKRVAAFIVVVFQVVIFADKLLPSQNPPGGLSPKQVPLFVSIGFDDNSYAGMENSGNEGGLKWAYDFFRTLKNPSGINQKETFDGTAARVTFFVTSCYISSNPSSEGSIYNLQWILNALYKDGHEIGNHSWNHTTFTGTGMDEWASQMKRCNTDLAKPAPPDSMVGKPGFDFSFGAGVKAADIVGWRTPFLQCNDNTFKALQSVGLLYDCSLEEGFQPEQNNSNFLWPYTLDQGSPGNEYLVSIESGKIAIGQYPGIWELPVYAVPASRTVASSHGSRSAQKMTGLDYNLWIDNANGGAHLTKEQFVSSLKRALDERLAGNRSPLIFGAHSDFYSSAWPHGSKTQATLRQRQQAIEEFVSYALTKPEVRVVPHKDIITWCKNPVPLTKNTAQGASRPLSAKISTTLLRRNGVVVGPFDALSASVAQIRLVSLDGASVLVATDFDMQQKRLCITAKRNLAAGVYILSVAAPQYSVKMRFLIQ